MRSKARSRSRSTRSKRKLTPRQKKLDKNKNGRIDAGDFRMMRKRRGGRVTKKRNK